MDWSDELKALAAAAEAAGVIPAEEDRLAYNLQSETPARAREVEKALAQQFGGAAIARPVFAAADDPDTGRFSRLEFVGVDVDLAEPIARDVGYAIAEAYGLDAAEPDLPTRFYFVPGEETPGADAESAIVKAFCEVKGVPPPNKHWAPALVRAPQAIAFSTAQGRPAGGQGVRVAQPDTGVAANLDLEPGALDPGLGWDLINGRAGAHDPLNYAGNKGHGTAVSSIVASRANGAVVGTAPMSQVYPIRCIRTVAVFNAEPVARAIEKAVEVRAQVITMSLGGVPSRPLRAMLRKAVQAGIIVVAAAGNCVRLVVWPARYPECIAVAGCNINGVAWRGSSRGEAVDITAPAEQVWHASATDARGFDEGQGTSFAVAIVAGAAAQWLGHFGAAAVAAEANRRGVTVQALFREAMRQTATPAPQLPVQEFGPGIVNIEALLRLPLGDIRAVVTPAERVSDDPRSTPTEFVEVLRLFAGDAEAAHIDWSRYGAEIGEVALRRAVSARAEGVDLPESAPPPAAAKLQEAVAASGNEALKRLLGQV